MARSLAYLVILLEVAPLFAGEPLPTKLKERKRRYIDGLKRADKGDLAELEQLVLECIQMQVSEIATTHRPNPQQLNGRNS